MPTINQLIRKPRVAPRVRNKTPALAENPYAGETASTSFIRLLTERLTELLTGAGREVFVHRQVPTGDGGLALGQAVVASRLRRRT